VKLDVPALLTSLGLVNFQGSFNLVFDTNGPKGALLVAGGSVDQRYTYVFEVRPRGIGESASKDLHYWSTANGDDTMVTVWNPADEAQDFVFALFYSGGHYFYPMRLDARATHTFNISEIVHSGLPDSEGNVIPVAIQSGKAEIGGPLGENQLVLVTMDSGIYNVRKATCGAPPCETCNGFMSVSIVDNPFVVAVGGTKQQVMRAQWNTGTYYDYTSQSTWSSSNTSVATVNTGVVSGVGAGSVTVSAVLSTGIPPAATICEDPMPPCPSGAEPFASAPGDSNPTVTFGYTPVVPVGSAASITAYVSGNTNNTTITLTIATVSGSGAASFLSGQSTTTITSTTTLQILGVQASSSPNNIQLSASIPSEGSGGTLAATNFTVATTNGAIPVNFRQTLARIDPGAVLHFEYKWDSSSGNRADISTCQVEEYVTYVGPNPYPWASPPYLPGYTTSWPSTGLTPVSASVSGLSDDHNHAPGWQTPYAFNYIGSDQKYQFQCPYYQNNQWIQLDPPSGTLPIGRVVNLTNGALPWTYQITKSGLTASINLP